MWLNLAKRLTMDAIFITFSWHHCRRHQLQAGWSWSWDHVAESVLRPCFDLLVRTVVRKTWRETTKLPPLSRGLYAWTLGGGMTVGWYSGIHVCMLHNFMLIYMDVCSKSPEWISIEPPRTRRLLAFPRHFRLITYLHHAQNTRRRWCRCDDLSIARVCPLPP